MCLDFGPAFLPTPLLFTCVTHAQLLLSKPNVVYTNHHFASVCLYITLKRTHMVHIYEYTSKLYAHQIWLMITRIRLIEVQLEANLL